MLFFGVFLHETARTAAKSRTNLSTANGPIAPEMALPSMFHLNLFVWNVGPSSRVRISVRHCKLKANI